MAKTDPLMRFVYQRQLLYRRYYPRIAGLSEKPPQMVRRTTITLLAALLLLCGSLAVGLRINGTHSVPPGIYWATGKHPERGDFVFVRPPPAPIFAVAKERGYLDVGYSPARTL